MAASYLALSFLYRLRPTPPKTSRSFRRHLRAQRAIRLLLLLRGFFDRGIVSISARFRATRPLAHACGRTSIPVRTRYEPGWALPRPAPPLSRFSRHGEGEDYTRAFGVGVVTRVAFCMTKCRTFGSSWFRPQPKHDPQFPLRDLPGSRRQVRAEARRSFTLVREQSATLRSRAGYNHPRRLPIDVDAGS